MSGPAHAASLPLATAPPQRAPALSSVVREVVSSSGEPLEREMRTLMEKRLGHDFSRVRVHHGGRAESSARSLHARAYAISNHVVIATPQFANNPDLLLHELTHVVQQEQANAIPPTPAVGADDTPEERETREVAAGRLLRPKRRVGPLVQREPTRPRAATGAAAIADVSAQTAKPGKSVSAGTLARLEWESLFRRHFTEPDVVAGEVESAHARYLYSRIYGWIDAQHFFAHIEFAESKGVAGATAEGIAIEKKQELMRSQVAAGPGDPAGYALELESNLIDPESFLHYQDTLFLALKLALNTMLSKREQELVKGFSDEQLAKFILDNAMSAWSYEDIVSNQLGVQFFALHGSYVNAGTDATEVRKRFIERITKFFAAIQVVEDPTEVKRLGAKLPGKERWTAPKVFEAAARKKFPELFEFDADTHRVRVAVYDREDAAEKKREEIAKLLPSIGLGLRVERFGESRFALYTAPRSHFGSLLIKWAIDRAVPTGAGGALVEREPPAPPKKRVYGPEL